MSELGSHPRFAGVRMNVALDTRERPVEESTPFSIGPSPHSHPSALFAWRFAFDTAFRLGEACVNVTPLAADPDAAFELGSTCSLASSGSHPCTGCGIHVNRIQR